MHICNTYPISELPKTKYSYRPLPGSLYEIRNCICIENQVRALSAAIKQYDGLKHRGDESDARHLAHLLRLGLLPEGHIMPKSSRAVRDLARKRMQLVDMRTANILSIETCMAQQTGIVATGLTETLDDCSPLRRPLFPGIGHRSIESVFAHNDV